jgi:tetratricopeptide (TPR) repeat protein
MKQVRCPGCQVRLTFGDDRLGEVVACPKCGVRMRLPKASLPKASLPKARSLVDAEAPIKPGLPPTLAATMPVTRNAGKPERANEDDEFDEVELAPPKRRGSRRDARGASRGDRSVARGGFHWVMAAVVGVAVTAALGGAGLFYYLMMREGDLAKVNAKAILQAARPAPFAGQGANQDEDDDEDVRPPKGVPPRPPVFVPLEIDNTPLTIAGIDLGFKVPPVSLPDQEKEIKERIDFNRRTTIEDYERIGKKDARWDDHARAAFKEAAEMFSLLREAKASLFTIHPLTKRAVEAGCDDPLILYLHSRALLAMPTDDHPGRLRRVHEAALAMEKSAYSNYRRCVALMAAVPYRVRPNAPEGDENREAERMLKAALELLGESVKKGERIPRAERWHYETLVDAVSLYSSIHRDTPKALAWMEKIVGEFPELQAPALKARGDVMTSYGWEARGGGFANQVTEVGWRLFRERLNDARVSLQKAADLNPKDGHAPALMILNCKAIGRGDLNETRDWFSKAMKADPDNYEACDQLMDYLDPKWHGSAEAVVGFGRSCRDSKNWRSRIPLLVADAHLRAVMFKSPNDQRRYLHSQPVWDDIKGVFEEYFSHCPDDNAERCRFASYCYYCGKFDICAEQFLLAGDNVIPFFLVGEAQMLAMRADALQRKKLMDDIKKR